MTTARACVIVGMSNDQHREHPNLAPTSRGRRMFVMPHAPPGCDAVLASMPAQAPLGPCDSAGEMRRKKSPACERDSTVTTRRTRTQ